MAELALHAWADSCGGYKYLHHEQASVSARRAERPSRGWASKNSRPTRSLSPLDLISPEETLCPLPPPHRPPPVLLCVCVCVYRLSPHTTTNALSFVTCVRLERDVISSRRRVQGYSDRFTEEPTSDTISLSNRYGFQKMEPCLSRGAADQLYAREKCSKSAD